MTYITFVVTGITLRVKGNGRCKRGEKEGKKEGKMCFVYVFCVCDSGGGKTKGDIDEVRLIFVATSNS